MNMLSKLIQRLFLPVLLLWALALQTKAAVTADDFFDPNVLQEVRLEIHHWQVLQEHFTEDTYYPANLEWRGVAVPNVGVRSRGRSSRSPIKPSLHLDMNHYQDQTFLGIKGFNLKANDEDASFLKERLSMLMFQRMGLPASRETHARLYINGQYQGLYLIVEEVHKDFLMRNFGEDKGYLYAYNPPEDRYQFEYLGPDTSSYSPLPFEPKTHETDPDPKPLEAMVRTINHASDSDS